MYHVLDLMRVNTYIIYNIIVDGDERLEHKDFVMAISQLHYSL